MWFKVNVIIFTEESGVKLPEINKWSGKISKGMDITKNKNIISLLNDHNLKIPSNDSDMETQYRNVLSDFIRPSKLMFSGTFLGVRNFANTLSGFISTDINIISSRYGLLKENDEIIPYFSHSKNSDDLEFLDKKTNFSQNMLIEADKFDIIILLFPKHYISYLLKEGWFDKLKPKSAIIIVSSRKLKPSFSFYDNVMFFERRGVTRIGIKNREEIVQKIKHIASA